jgi:RNA polymerase sigma-70 factor (ECF subfamily)
MDSATSQPRAFPMQAFPLDWDRTYVEHAPRVYNYFRFRLGLNSEAEDLTSRTFEKAWRARDRYRQDRAAVSTWLFAIARNVTVDHLRAHRTHVSLEESMVLAGEESPDMVAEQSSNLARLAALTKDLPERDRELLALKYGAVATNREISNLTGLSESNVGTILHRLVHTLRSRW